MTDSDDQDAHDTVPKHFLLTAESQKNCEAFAHTLPHKLDDDVACTCYQQKIDLRAEHAGFQHIATCYCAFTVKHTPAG